MKVAELTMAAIEEAIERDQGNSFRRYSQELLPLQADAYAQNEDQLRGHLGASLLGRECPRELWYSFRWAKTPKHGGRILRLFNRGHLEEARMLASLKCIGVELWSKDAEGKQLRASFCDGHFGGSLDGIVRGIPDMPEIPMLAEFKTHNTKSFKKLVTDGLHFVKWEHLVQMTMYMGAFGLTHGLYMATNKDNDEYYCEIIGFDNTTYQRYYKRGMEIINSPTPPPRIHNNPSWYKCKFCDYHSICHGSGTAERNCRTCVAARPMNGGGWHCSDTGEVRDTQLQKEGCSQFIPITPI